MAAGVKCPAGTVQNNVSELSGLGFWAEEHKIKTLPWPDQSSDLNPNKNSLKRDRKRNMAGHMPSDKAKLDDLFLFIFFAPGVRNAL